MSDCFKELQSLISSFQSVNSSRSEEEQQEQQEELDKSQSSITLNILHKDGEMATDTIDLLKNKTLRDVLNNYELDPQQHTIRSLHQEYTNLDTLLTDLPQPRIYQGRMLRRKITIQEKNVGG